MKKTPPTEAQIPLTKKGVPRKANSGRKSIFKDGEFGKMAWLLLPESKHDELLEKFIQLREPYLKDKNN